MVGVSFSRANTALQALFREKRIMEMMWALMFLVFVVMLVSGWPQVKAIAYWFIRMRDNWRIWRARRRTHAVERADKEMEEFFAQCKERDDKIAAEVRAMRGGR